jgi:type IV fimbrial biogenesis protein FimT
MGCAACLQRGLTLVELTVGLAILAVLSTLAVPEIGRFLARARLQAAAEQLALAMSDARFDASRQGRTVHMTIEPGEHWCWSLSAAPSCSCQQAMACQKVRVAASRRGTVRIDEGLLLSFAPSADARLTPAAVNLSTAFGDRLQVRLTPMGRARVCSPQGQRNAIPAC